MTDYLLDQLGASLNAWRIAAATLIVGENADAQDHDLPLVRPWRGAEGCRVLRRQDRWGFSWQIVPRALIAALNDGDRAAAKWAMQAMMTMRRIDIARIEAARAGKDMA